MALEVEAIVPTIVAVTTTKKEPGRSLTKIMIIIVEAKVEAEVKVVVTSIVVAVVVAVPAVALIIVIIKIIKIIMTIEKVATAVVKAERVVSGSLARVVKVVIIMVADGQG